MVDSACVIIMENVVTDKKSFRSDLHERAWYLQQNKLVESYNEKDPATNENKASAKHDPRLEALTKSFDDRIDRIVHGLWMAGVTFFTISILVCLVTFVIVCIQPAIQEQEIYLEISRFLLGSLIIGSILIFITKYDFPKLYFECFLLLIFLLFSDILPIIISEMLNLMTRTLKRLYYD